MKSAEEIISALKGELNIRCDKELAELLDIRPHKLTLWKKNNEVDVKLIVEKFSNIDLTAVFNDDCYQKISELNRQRMLKKLQVKLQEQDSVYVYYIRFNKSENTLEGHIYYALAHKFVFGDVDVVYYDALLYPGQKEAVRVKAVVNYNYIAAGPNGENCRVTLDLDDAIVKLFNFIQIRNVYENSVECGEFRAFSEDCWPYPPIYIHHKDGTIVFPGKNRIHEALVKYSDELYQIVPSYLDYYKEMPAQAIDFDDDLDYSSLCSIQEDDLEALKNLKHELESETEGQLVSFAEIEDSFQSYDDILEEERPRTTHPNFK